MQITVSGKQIDISASFRAYVEQQLDLVVGKYFDRGIEASVTVSRTGQELRVDIKAHFRPGNGLAVPRGE